MTQSDAMAAREVRNVWWAWTVLWSTVGIVALLLGYAGLLGYWRFVSPVPDIRVHQSFVEEVEPKDREDILHRPGMFRVVRDIEASSSADGRITAYFETPAPKDGDTITSTGGEQARPTIIQIKIAEDEDHIQKGRHWRVRVWETPAALPEGEWVYQSVARFCNPLRCDYFPFPPVKVKLGGPPNPVAR